MTMLRSFAAWILLGVLPLACGAAPAPGGVASDPGGQIKLLTQTEQAVLQVRAIARQLLAQQLRTRDQLAAQSQQLGVHADLQVEQNRRWQSLADGVEPLLLELRRSARLLIALLGAVVVLLVWQLSRQRWGGAAVARLAAAGQAQAPEPADPPADWANSGDPSGPDVLEDAASAQPSVADWRMRPAADALASASAPAVPAQDVAQRLPHGGAGASMPVDAAAALPSPADTRDDLRLQLRALQQRNLSGFMQHADAAQLRLPRTSPGGQQRPSLFHHRRR